MLESASLKRNTDVRDSGDLSIGEASVLVIPGWNGSGAGHWQTLWEQKYLRFRRVEQRNWTRPPREELSLIHI